MNAAKSFSFPVDETTRRDVSRMEQLSLSIIRKDNCMVLLIIMLYVKTSFRACSR